MFISRSSLWTRVYFQDIDKTDTYIKRSRACPLEFCFRWPEFIDGMLDLMIPNIYRLKSLTIGTNALPEILEHFYCNMPFLKKLDLSIAASEELGLDDALFGGDLLSLRELRLERVTSRLPWKNLANLQVFYLQSCSHRYGVTQILDFFESAPLLHTVSLEYPMPDTSDAPPERIVPLRYLKTFRIKTKPSPSILLHRLHIPVGASLYSEFHSSRDESPLLDYLPNGSPYFDNLSHITAINLFFGRGQSFARLSGPSGDLHVQADRMLGPLYRYVYPEVHLGTRGDQILRSLSHPMFSRTQRLSISGSQLPESAQVEEGPVIQMLSFMGSLRTLSLIRCDVRPFVFALDPEQNPSQPVLCSDMEELIIKPRGPPLDVEPLIDMAKNRASRGAILPSVTFFHLRGREGDIVLELRGHVKDVRHLKYDETPAWNAGEAR